MEQVLLPREPPGQTFSAWLRALLLAHGFELERTIKTLSARWDHRMLPVADGRAVSVLVRKWVREAITGVVGVPFDPPLSLPMDLVSRWPRRTAWTRSSRRSCRVRGGGWLTQRPRRTDLPQD